MNLKGRQELMGITRIDRRLRILIVAIVGAAALALALASASVALRSHTHRSVAQRQASIVPFPDLGIFSRAQSAAERNSGAVGEVHTMLDALPPTDPSTLRFAIVGVGPSQHTAFVVRSRAGQICSGLTNFTSGCVEGLPREMPAEITYGGESATEGPIVWGILRNDVRSVEVVVNGQSYPATVGRNAYFFQAPVGKTAQDLQSVVVHLADGSSTTEPIG